MIRRNSKKKEEKREEGAIKSNKLFLAGCEASMGCTCHAPAL